MPPHCHLAARLHSEPQDGRHTVSATVEIRAEIHLPEPVGCTPHTSIFRKILPRV